MAVAFVGDESLVLQCAAHCLERGDAVAFVATDDETIRSDAEGLGIAVVPRSDLADASQRESVDVLFSIANERVLPPAVLAAVPQAVNFHDGPLPERGGVGVTTWAIHDGAVEHGVTWHLMTDEVDAGAVLLDDRFPIAEDETGLSLNARCFEAGLATFPAVLDLLRDPARAAVGASGEPELFHGRHDRPSVWIDPMAPAALTDRLVRSLDLGPLIRNRLGSARLWTPTGTLVVGATSVRESSGRPPGTIVSAGADGLVVATVDGDLVLRSVIDPHAGTLEPGAVLALLELSVGDRLTGPPDDVRERLVELDPALSRAESRWLDILRRDLAVPEVIDAGAGAYDGSGPTATVPADGITTDVVVAATVLWWSRATGAADATFGLVDRAVLDAAGPLAPALRAPLVAVEVDESEARGSLVGRIDAAGRVARERGGYLADLPVRDPGSRARSGPSLLVRVDAEAWPAAPSARLVLDISTAGRVVVRLAPGVAAGRAQRVAEQIALVARQISGSPDGPVGDIELDGDHDRESFASWNDTGLDHDRSLTLDAAFRSQASSTPSATAVSCGARSLTYAQLAEAVDVAAARLVAVGVEPGGLVGIALERDIELVVAVLATLSVGAAYVPLDPEYPEDRLRGVVDDSGLGVVVGRPDLVARLGSDLTAVGADDLLGSDAGVPVVAPHGPDAVAYVIYTSGSTGKPKGVVLEHRQVVNFFAAMDRVIDHDHPGTWLAVTSLSFDISVLELLWTLTRGFHVVVHRRTVGAGSSPGTAGTVRAPSWSLFFFAAGEAQAAEGYRLLLESARYADENGFEALWVPERHFHAFGAAYPNPSVAGAAVAAVTSRVGIRAGSVVLPLHATARVAEEWAVVDNLSRGRVGISFAAGWQPRDFVLNPAAYATARADLGARIDEVRALWRGESVALPGHDGEPVDVVTLPRPVQPELPTWMTSAGSTGTFEEAGRRGHHVLTHLLGQSIEQLAANIEAYRAARRAAGHEGEGQVTLMLHTHLDDDAATAKARAEQPMRSYLGTATGLIKNMASSFPTFAGGGVDADEAFRSLSDEEMDQLLTVAAERYIETSGLFGTPDDAATLVSELAAVGVDEIACLVDFGIDTDDVLTSLPMIGQAKEMVDERLGGSGAPDPEPVEPLGVVAARHGVTHLQCTPSLAEILLAEPADRVALAQLDHMMVGGEAFPEGLARELRGLVPGRLTNMYGPTETTIWSLVHEIEDVTGPVPIGRPIANTTCHVLDPAGRAVPLGWLGELHIGGEGVARGYLHREELTAQRFVERDGHGRCYATGDLVRFRDDGSLDFAGRADFQVKIRGHRIELGEIEAVLESDDAVERAVVVVRGEGPSTRLVAFVTGGAGVLDVQALDELARSRLPEVMVPDLLCELASFPLTPNGKVDRGALPEVTVDRVVVIPESERPEGDEEQVVADAWERALGHAIPRSANVFDAGGNSLLAVAVFRDLQERVGAPLVLTDLFRHPTVASLAAHLAASTGDRGGDVDGADADGARTGADRGALRRRARSGAADRRASPR